MQREWQRVTAALAKADPAPYYIRYTTADINATASVGMSGSIVVSSEIQKAPGRRDHAHGLSRASSRPFHCFRRECALETFR
jgi:hypothetical protein